MPIEREVDLWLKGEGSDDRDFMLGGESGDLHLELKLVDDEAYRIVDGDLEARVVLTPWEAEAGAKVDVRTARGVATVTVPPVIRSTPAAPPPWSSSRFWASRRM